MGEGELAHHSARADDPASQGDPLAALDHTIEIGKRRGDRMGAVGAWREWIDPSGAQAIKLGQALLLELI